MEDIPNNYCTWDVKNLVSNGINCLSIGAGKYPIDPPPNFHYRMGGLVHTTERKKTKIL